MFPFLKGWRILRRGVLRVCSLNRRPLTDSHPALFLRASLRGRMKPGPKPLSRERVYRATWAILESLTTIDGKSFDDWVMKLTPEDLEKLQRPPGKKRRLSLDTWKNTTEGFAVFGPEEDQERFEAWATEQTEKLYKYKKLQMQELLNFVEHSLGRLSDKKHPPKGDFLKYVLEAKDLFLMRWCLTWMEIPPALRHKRQPGFRGDLATFYQLQHDYLNSAHFCFEPFPASKID